MIRLLVFAAALVALLGAFVLVAAFTVRSAESAGLVLLVALAGLAGVRAVERRGSRPENPDVRNMGR